MALNVLGTELLPCSYDPLTGYLRDGCCHTREDDTGSHVVCARVTREFLAFSLERGNDLSTPRPEFRFRGLKPGDRWCLCANRWAEAFTPPARRRRWCSNARTRRRSSSSTSRRFARTPTRRRDAVGATRAALRRRRLNCAAVGEVDERFKSHAWKACGG